MRKNLANLATLNKTQKVLAKFKINVQPFLTGVYSQKEKLKNKSARIKFFFGDFQKAEFDQNLRKIARFLYMVQLGS